MGEKIPPVPFIIDPVKVYCCKMSAWYSPGGCGVDLAGPTHCCVLGALIIAWLAGGFECNGPPPMCAFLGWAPQRIESLDGPFVDVQACVDADCYIF